MTVAPYATHRTFVLTTSCGYLDTGQLDRCSNWGSSSEPADPWKTTDRADQSSGAHAATGAQSTRSRLVAIATNDR